MPRGHPKSTTPLEERNEWQTPDPIYWWATKIFGKCDIDLAATRGNTKCTKFFSKEDNALAQVWAEHGKRGWCNPPYSEPNLWVEAAIWEKRELGFQTVMLLSSLNSNALDELIFNQAQAIIFFTGRWIQGARGNSGRIPFLRPNGKPVTGNMKGSILVNFAPREMTQIDPRILSVCVTDIYKWYLGAHWLI